MKRSLIGIVILLGYAALLGSLGTIPPSPYQLLPGPRMAPRVDVPAFAHRQLGHGIGDPGFREWRQDHRLKSEWPFNHNLHRLLEGKLDEAPREWLSLINGERRIPKGGRGVHPNLAHPGLQSLVADQVTDYFQNNPDKPALSIALADSYAFDQSELTREIVEPLNYFRRRPDYSDLVFSFSHAVAEQVFESGKFENRYLTQLAYYWAENIPDPNPRHGVSRSRGRSQVIPTLTSDRLQWWNEDYKANDQELIKQWSNAGPAFLGAWDYYEGNGFFIPRHAPGLIAESIKYLHAHHTRAFFAEGPPIWGLDAPKFWLAAQLLWDVDQDPEELQHKFFTSMYGPAAGSMRQFFDACEQTWLNQDGEWQWLKYFRHPSQAELFPPERCAELMDILDQAWTEARGKPLIRKRIQLTRDAFAFTQAASAYYFAWKALAQNPLENQEDLNRFEKELKTYNQKRLALEQTPPLGPQKNMWSAKERLLALNPEGRLEYVRSAFSRIRGIRRDRQSDQERLQEEADHRKFSFDRKIFPNDLAGLDAWTLRSANLENGLGISAEPYEHYELRRIPGAGRNGGGALQIKNSNYTSLYAWQKVSPGKTYAAAGWIRGHVQPGSWTGVYLAYYDADHNPLDAAFVDETAAGTYTDWIPLVALEKAPEKAAWAFVAIKVYRQLPGDWILIDNLEFKEIP